MDNAAAELEKYARHYSRMSSDELLRLSADAGQLEEAAQKALESELAARRLQDQPLTVEKREYYRRVGGWLALFVFGLVVLGPLFAILSILNLFQEFKQALPPVVAALDIVFFLAMCFGVYAGVRLLQLRSNAVNIAKIYLGTVFFHTVILFAALIIKNSANASFDLTDAAIPEIRNIIYVLVWYSYLERSKRVAATYPVKPAL